MTYTISESFILTAFPHNNSLYLFPPQVTSLLTSPDKKHQ